VKWILKTLDGMVGTGFIWLRIGIKALLNAKMLGIS
jgi:hypothetical protein